MLTKQDNNEFIFQKFRKIMIIWCWMEMEINFRSFFTFTKCLLFERNYHHFECFHSSTISTTYDDLLIWCSHSIHEFMRTREFHDCLLNLLSLSFVNFISLNLSYFGDFEILKFISTHSDLSIDRLEQKLEWDDSFSCLITWIHLKEFILWKKNELKKVKQMGSTMEWNWKTLKFFVMRFHKFWNFLATKPFHVTDCMETSRSLLRKQNWNIKQCDMVTRRLGEIFPILEF